LKRQLNAGSFSIDAFLQIHNQQQGPAPSASTVMPTVRNADIAKTTAKNSLRTNITSLAAQTVPAPGYRLTV
jgi:hypothetical protein